MQNILVVGKDTKSTTSSTSLINEISSVFGGETCQPTSLYEPLFEHYTILICSPEE